MPGQRKRLFHGHWIPDDRPEKVPRRKNLKVPSDIEMYESVLKEEAQDREEDSWSMPGVHDPLPLPGEPKHAVGSRAHDRNELTADEKKERFLKRLANGELLNVIRIKIGVNMGQIDAWAEEDPDFSAALERSIARRARRARLLLMDRMETVIGVVVLEALKGRQKIAAARLLLEMSGMRPIRQKGMQPPAAESSPEESELRDIIDRDQGRIAEDGTAGN